MPELREPTLEILRRIKWQGMALRAGVNYPLLAWRELTTEEESVSMSYNGWDGVWIHPLDDIYYCTFFRREERLSFRDYLRIYRRQKSYAVWSASDPKPFFAECYNMGKKTGKAVLNSDYRKTLSKNVQKLPAESSRKFEII